MADGQFPRHRTAMAIPRITAPSVSAIEDALSEAGCLTIEQAIDAETIDEIERELRTAFERTPRGEGLFLGRNTRRFSSLFARSRTAAALALQPEILSAVERLLRGPAEAPHTDCIQITLTQSIQIDAGEPAQILHRDDELYPFEKKFEVMVNVMWPFDDFNAENGGTRLAAGSHRWPRQIPEPDGPEIANAVCPRGGAVIWLGSLVHGGGANRSRSPRRGIVISYALGWLAPSEKLLLSISPARARELPQRLQRLIGYQVHKPNLGWVESRDPIEWLRGELSDETPATDHLTEEQAAWVEHLSAMRNSKQSELS